MFRWLERHTEEVAASALVALLAILVVAQVVMRYVFDAPLHWSDEFASYAMIWMIYLGGSLAVRERAHIRILNGALMFPRAAATAIVVVGDLLWAAFNALLFWQSVLLVASFWEFPVVSSALAIEQKWPYLAVPVGFALMLLRLGQVYWRWYAHGVPPSRELA